MAGEREFTLEELAKYNGADGKPAYFAYRGKSTRSPAATPGRTATIWEPIRRAPISPKPWERPRMAKKFLMPSRRSGF